MARMDRKLVTFPLATPTSWAYLAGIVDGEGCISIMKSTGARNKGAGRYALRMHICNVDTRLIAWLRDVFGSFIHYGGAAKSQHRPAWVWNCQGTRCEIILENLLPYLIAKREQAEVALSFAKTLRMVKACRSGVPEEIAILRQGYKDQLHAMKKQQYPPIEGVPLGVRNRKDWKIKGSDVVQ